MIRSLDMNSDAKPIVLLGGGGHAKVVIEATRLSDRTVAGFLDQGRSIGETLDDVPCLGGDDWLETADLAAHDFHVAITNTGIRERLRRRLEERRANLATLAHPSAIVSPLAKIGAGCFIAVGAIVNPGAALGVGTVVNSGAQIDHDSSVGADSHVAPGAVLCGYVRCGDRVLVGAGAIVIPGVKVGNDVTIGAGATVIRDVPDNTRVIGTPATPE